ncbi:unnamed protein product [Allacma fusca]|uniref:J domain-containing protein n=1 Tax=Allacma fusca TaxID=39272 RepID=A0A8J2J426_9HEXA|nr:unnamed protein product [Allacma fusca]
MPLRKQSQHSSKLRQGKQKPFKIDHQDVKPNPGRSSEPVGVGESARDNIRVDSGQVKYQSKAKPDVYEVDPCSSDSEPEIIYDNTSGKNNVIEVNIDSDSEVIQIGSSDMEEDCKSMFENDVEMADAHSEQDQEDPLRGAHYSEDGNEVVYVADIYPEQENALQDDSIVGLPETELSINGHAEEVSPVLVAAERKRLGNDYFVKGEYHQALKMYTAAIEIMPTEAAYFGNRSACLIMLNKFKDAAQDARTAISLDPNLKNGYLRLVRSTLALGDTISCESAFTAVATKPELNIDLTEEKRKLDSLIQLKANIMASEEKKDFRRVLFLTERAKDIAVGDVMLKIKKAECLIKLGRFVEAQEQCTEILQSDGMIMEAITLRAFCFYQGDNLDKALQYYKQALQLAPDNKSAAINYRKIKQIKELRELGATKFKQQIWTEADSAYKQCLELIESEEQNNPTLESKINFNLALVSGKNSLDNSLLYVNKAITLNPNYVKALLHRATILMNTEKFDEAIKDYELVEKLDPTSKDIRRQLDAAKLAAKKAKRKDYYKILGIDKKASPDEIKKAYKKRALVHHPDRHASASETERKDQERKFKEVLEAYEILLDDKKRRRYDLGLDVNESGSPNYETFDATSMFGHMFFQPAGMGGMGGMGGRPGGFHQFRAGPGYSGFRR